jgi:cytochrome d ubiquinol oxidase subunit II
MINFASFIDLPAALGSIIVLAIGIYVVLDGFDLGIGILFPFAPSDSCKDVMINSIAPFWDGNETWLVLGGGGLFAAFPLAFAIICPAVYLPIIIMLIALVLRGVAFEFRFKAQRIKKLWDLCFHFGSLFATFMQGMILGTLVQGIEVHNNVFAGDAYAWVSGFTVMTGFALVCGYTLLGATWLVMKTDDITQTWARKSAAYIILHVLLFMLIVCIWTPQLDQRIFDAWFSLPNILYLAWIPIATIIVALRLIFSINTSHDREPFILSLLLFLLGFIGLIVGTWPYIVPRSITFAQAAAAESSQSLILLAMIIILPIVLFNTGYNYYVFRGKTSRQDMYH